MKRQRLKPVLAKLVGALSAGVPIHRERLMEELYSISDDSSPNLRTSAALNLNCSILRLRRFGIAVEYNRTEKTYCLRSGE